LAGLKVIAAAVVLALVVAAGVAYYETYQVEPGGCLPLKPGSITRSQVSKTTFGAITEYKLPSQDRWPNAVITSPDGSVWFAEQEVPGVAHFYPGNGTLVEYAWPGYAAPVPPSCFLRATSAGIALWNGRVWATDEYTNGILGVSPGDGSTVRINTTSASMYPYWLTVGPDGNLWFTSDNTPASIGRIFPNLTMSVTELEGLGTDEPIQLAFVNSSLAFVVALSQAENFTTKQCLCTGHVYSFDPSTVSSAITPTVVGGNYTLVEPTSVAYSDGKIWVTQHGPSSVVSYDFASGLWTEYPTSTVPWSTTLPLAIAANGSQVWFNEHYANKMAELDDSTHTLTEFSESDPPASNGSGIQNDESFAITDGGAWFTSESGNYVGFVSAAYKPSFQVAVAGSNDGVSLQPGGSTSVSLSVSGSWSSPLGINESDSETYGSIPYLIHITPSASTIPAGSSPYTLDVEIAAAQSILPGNYVVAVTLTDGGIQQSAYIFVRVS
jgi:streptogramin lyase